MKRKHTQAGFTIIELSIATLVFSILLAICMTAFLGVGRLFVKSANLSLTQQNARTIMDSISSDIRFSDSQPTLTDISDATNPYFCIGLHRYKFHLFYQVQGSDTATNYGLVRENVSAGCPPLSVAGLNPVEMLGSGMQLNDLHFGQPPDYECSGIGGKSFCTITINLLFYGTDSNVFASTSQPADPLHAADAHCSGNDLGTEFCASTSFSATVLQNIPQGG